MRRIRFLIWKELIELGQDPRLFGIVVLAPILQLFMLAYAATTDVRNVPIVIADADRSTLSRELISRFDASPSFTIAGIVNSPNEVDAVLERGQAWLALVVPRGYGAALERGQSTAVQVIADGSDANSAGVSLSYASNLIAGYSQEVSVRTSAARGGHGTVATIQPVVRVWSSTEQAGTDSRSLFHHSLPGTPQLRATIRVRAGRCPRDSPIRLLE